MLTVKATNCVCSGLGWASSRWCVLRLSLVPFRLLTLWSFYGQTAKLSRRTKTQSDIYPPGLSSVEELSLRSTVCVCAVEMADLQPPPHPSRQHSQAPLWGLTSSSAQTPLPLTSCAACFCCLPTESALEFDDTVYSLFPHSPRKAFVVFIICLQTAVKNKFSIKWSHDLFISHMSSSAGLWTSLWVNIASGGRGQSVDPTLLLPSLTVQPLNMNKP